MFMISWMDEVMKRESSTSTFNLQLRHGEIKEQERCFLHAFIEVRVQEKKQKIAWDKIWP